MIDDGQIFGQAAAIIGWLEPATDESDLAIANLALLGSDLWKILHTP
jgi:hypothetical protein